MDESLRKAQAVVFWAIAGLFTLVALIMGVSGVALGEWAGLLGVLALGALAVGFGRLARYVAAHGAVSRLSTDPAVTRIVLWTLGVFAACAIGFAILAHMGGST